MLIYKDLLGESHDELLADSYDPVEKFDGIAIEADCAMINVGGESFDTGANASAEEGTEDTVAKVNNVVHSFRLEEISYLKGDKKQITAELGAYMKNLEKHMKENGKSDEEVKAWKDKAKKFAMHIVKNYKDFDFYKGENGLNDSKGMLVLLNYREDGVTPYVTLWKDGLIEEKV